VMVTAQKVMSIVAEQFTTNIFYCE